MAEWLKTDEDGMYECSECHSCFFSRKFKYCPECGIKMDEDVVNFIRKSVKYMFYNAVQKGQPRQFVWIMGSDVKKVLDAADCETFYTTEKDSPLWLSEIETIFSWPVIQGGEPNELSLCALCDKITI